MKCATINYLSPYLYVGNICNNNCIFCSEADSKWLFKNTATIKKEIRYIRKHYDFISFMGREPTLRKDIVTLLKFAIKQNFRFVNITSNGRMFAYKDFVKDLISVGISGVGISLYGADASMHDRQTRYPGSFNQTIQGIENVMQYSNSISILINILLNKINYTQCERMLSLLAKFGIKEINILNAAPLSDRSCTRAIVARLSDLASYVVKYFDKFERKYGIKFLLIEFPPCSIPSKYRNYFFPCLEKNPLKIKIPLCWHCDYISKCDGILKTYINLYGIKEFTL